MSEHAYPSIAITANEVHGSALSVTGSVVRQFSDEWPALLRLGLRNETEREQTVYSAPPQPFPAFRNRLDDSHRMYLITEDEDGFLHSRENEPIIPDAPVDGCWRIRQTGGHGQALVGYRLSSGGSKEADYVVLADADAPDCLPNGGYHFDGTIHLDDTGDTVEWKLTVTVR